MTADSFLAQVLATMGAMGGLGTMAKISAIITLLISSTKVSALNKVWAKLGPAQVWVAPFLGLVAGVAGLGAGGVPISAPLVFAYVTAGGGAVFLHELLDSVKDMPGIGVVYQGLISLVERFLGGGTPPTPGPTPPKIGDVLK